MKKRLDELNVIDNFMFNELMMQEDEEKAKEFCRAILEPIIERKIGTVRIEIESQKIVQGKDVDKRGIQMDAYIKVYKTEDGEERADVSVGIPIIYDVEPNTQRTDSDEKRSRIYHSLIDSHMIKSGTPYKDISDVIVIWILPYDPFGYDRMVYTVERKCVEVPQLQYEDGDKTLFLYAYGKKDIPSKRLADMLRFIVDSKKENAVDEDMKTIYNMMQQIRTDQKIGVRYMQSWEEKDYYFSEGKAEGKVEGKAELLLEMLADIGEVSEELRTKILNEKDGRKIKSWTKLAVTSETVEEFEKRIQ